MIKRMLFRAAFLLVIVGGAAVYLSYFKGIDLGTLLARAMSVTSSLGSMDFESLRPALREDDVDGATVLRAGSARAYKWLDSLGQWHYTQIAPPPDAVLVRSIELDPELNVIAGIKVPAPTDDESDAEEPVAQTPAPKLHESLPDNPYSPDAIKKLFDDAEALTDRLNERHAVQDQLLNAQ